MTFALTVLTGEYLFFKNLKIKNSQYPTPKIIVRYFKKDKISDFVRITIGTPEEMDALVSATKEILADY